MHIFINPFSYGFLMDNTFKFNGVKGIKRKTLAGILLEAPVNVGSEKAKLPKLRVRPLKCSCCGEENYCFEIYAKKGRSITITRDNDCKDNDYMFDSVSRCLLYINPESRDYIFKFK